MPNTVVCYVRPRALVAAVLMATPLNTMPSTESQATSETLPWVHDYIQVLQPGETIASITSNLYDTTVGGSTPVSLSDAPTLSGTQVTQIIRGSELTAGHTYRLETHATITVNVKVWGGFTDIMCPF